ncbi:PD-(D/E)XK motif protein [Bradyrhizobium japonicum]|uniref:PD-(D/E)XK motif protein n=1 Tax=Bradyrhizobium japonicum TaxID=375 RepID=UPI001BAA0546|nr:PD-(D/E)XK motif protein [Bradyrhizobium japonicum]MBR0911501.1 PD-(D/E)XK motif protein [Bradyrhizobium japonicum]
MSIAATAWDALLGEGRREPGWHLRRIHIEAPCEISAGIRQPGDVKGLILETSVDSVPPDIDLPRSRGFHVEPQLVGTSRDGRVRFALALTDDTYHDVFAVLCDHVAEAASAAPTARTGLREWIRQLHVWQEFMARHGPDGLSEDAVLGLFGELIILRDQLSPRLGLDAAITAWAGPRGEPNDFELPGGCLEVKATSRQAPSTLQISNLDQLDDHRSRILLTNVRLRPDRAGTTLPDLVADLRRRLGDSKRQSLADFNARLIAAGYVDLHANLYPTAWITDRIDLYAVRDRFPRLTRRDVSGGIRSCTYSIAIADCAPYLTTEADLDDLAGGRL